MDCTPLYKYGEPTYANVVSKNLQPQFEVKKNEIFSRQESPQNQGYHIPQLQQPFLGQTSHHPLLDPENTKKQIMEIKSVIMGLNQKVMRLEKSSVQM